MNVNINTLTQVEIRLLANVILFIKIVKYDDIFGQYGFKGQAILFVHDISSVFWTKKLPKLVLKSSDSIRLLVIIKVIGNSKHPYLIRVKFYSTIIINKAYIMLFYDICCCWNFHTLEFALKHWKSWWFVQLLKSYTWLYIKIRFTYV